jgi:RNA polymerase sigma-70 factor (ECF subfamily)
VDAVTAAESVALLSTPLEAARVLAPVRRADRAGVAVAASAVIHRPEPAASGEERLIERLRDGDEAAFVALVEQHGPGLRRLARMYTSADVADEVVQDTWIAVLNGLDRFEGRAALRTWIVRILINIARGRGEREHRQIPFSAFVDPSAEPEWSVSPDRFRPAGGEWSGHWISFPERWDEQPETSYLSSESVAVAISAINALPPAQQEVVSLRDVDGWSSDEVCEALGISPGNQRVLLHRGRSKVRAALERSIAERRAAAGTFS